MFILLGSLIVMGSIIAGYTMHGGHLLVLFQITELIIICGAALGSLLISNPLPVTKRVIKGIGAAIKGSKITKASYTEFLSTIYALLQVARRDGLVALESHVEKPKASPIFKKAPLLLANPHALNFMCDTLRTMICGTVDPHELEELMDQDLDAMHTEEIMAPQALSTLGDALPGLGIVAAVLGVVITMGQIDQPPAVIGHSVAAALVGTFLGILLCYGFVGPLARNMEHMIHQEGAFLRIIKSAILAFARGSVPSTVIEYARRTIGPEERPSFAAAEKLMGKAA